MSKQKIYELSRQDVDVEVFDKPRTLVRGTLRASKSPDKLRTLVRRKIQGLFDVINSLMKYFGGYIDIPSRTFNGEVGPTGRMHISYRESNFASAEPMTLNPSRRFGLRAAMGAMH